MNGVAAANMMSRGLHAWLEQGAESPTSVDIKTYRLMSVWLELTYGK